LKHSLIFENGPSAPINSLHLMSFCVVFSSMCSSCFFAFVALFSKNNSAPLSVASFIVSWSNLVRSITNAWTLSPPMVNICPDGECMFAPLILFWITLFFGMFK